jgi:isochorismate synthase EntC
VAGLPKEKALGIIAKNENFERGLYAGWLGVFQHKSFKSWVNLRCARIYDSKAVLFAGAGVNSGSIAQREWDETGLKMQIIGSCLTEPQ